VSIVLLPQVPADDEADIEVELPAGFADLPPVMSPRVLAEQLEVTPKSLERWRDGGTGPAYIKVPGSSLIRYSRDDVAAWLRTGRVETRA